MIQTREKHLALSILVVCVSVLALQTPLSSLVHAQVILTQSSVMLSATGIAFRIDDGSTTSATLMLTGNMQNDQNGKLGDLSGNLQIGSITYNISNGQGEANRQGNIEIIADAGDQQNLTLHGTNRMGDVIFEFPESELSSQYSLYLVGQLSSSGNSLFSSPSSESSFSSQSNSSSSRSAQSSSNFLVSSQISEFSFGITQNATENTTIAQTTTSAPSIAESATSTVPTTQPSSLTTLTVTANVTVTVTTTSTVANTTITVH